MHAKPVSSTQIGALLVLTEHKIVIFLLTLDALLHGSAAAGGVVAHQPALVVAAQAGAHQKRHPVGQVAVALRSAPER